MCGIFGAISFDGPFDRAAFETFSRLTDLVSYRGPDDSGHVALNFANREHDTKAWFDVFLGSRRLAILDLSTTGHQPMAHGDHWITYNGEIFNYIELRRELEALGHVFRTGTDTEVILHVFDEYGEDGFERLNGMWAFAIVDLAGKRIILSRDRFSIKPLYTLSAARRLYFASEIKQLLPLLPTRQVNETVLSEFLSQGLLDHLPDTFFKRIQRVPAKSNVIVDYTRATVSQNKYWEFSEGTRYAAINDEEDIAAEFRELFRDSVRIRLRSDVPVGLLLSGGLDSSAIAVVSEQAGAGTVRSFSIVAEEKQYSEARFIQALVDTGIRSEKITFRPSDVMDDLEKAVYHSDEPFGGLSVLAQHKLLRAAKQATDVTVLLSGQGGDEVLLGYLKFFFFYVRQLFRRGQYARGVKELLGSTLAGTAVHQCNFAEVKRYLPAHANQRSRLLRKPPHAVPIWNCDDLRTRQMIDIDSYSVPALTHYEDRNAAAHSLEVRHPFLDHRLVDFVLNIPVEFKIRDGWTKYLLRQSLPELPKVIRWRKDKQPFLTPEALWLKRELAPLVSSLFSNSKLEQMGILDEQEFLRHYNVFRHGASIAPAEISRVVVAELWARQFLN